jgi:hypothetical protein
MFLNCVLKPVFRSKPERGFQERMRSLAVRRAHGYGVRRPGGIQGHRNYPAGIPSATSRIGSAADVLPDHTRTPPELSLKRLGQPMSLYVPLSKRTHHTGRGQRPLMPLQPRLNGSGGHAVGDRDPPPRRARRPPAPARSDPAASQVTGGPPNHGGHPKQLKALKDALVGLTTVLKADDQMPKR